MKNEQPSSSSSSSVLQEISEVLAKITPGEWIARRAKLPVDMAFDFAITDERGEVIAEAFGRTSVTNFPPVEANAQAIAALPRLLRHAQAEIEGLQREKVRLTDFVAHRTHCALYHCGRCTLPIASDIHYVGTVDSHVVQPQTCDCGLTPLLEGTNARRF